ncbi:MAG: efflux RND transporter periplasmic adaptor subunit [Lachnospiraceae bacterium]|nr:efflux RND transporter periplasmic adaptor subunit [Lachnospiraceae bacterium]MBQ8263125.1 efflux RND transporter periplasmic adaptor subunit [Lachnospiraceae bacterium]
MAKVKSKKKKRIIIIVIVVIIVGLIIVGNLFGGEQQVEMVTTQEVTRGTITAQISGSGTVQSDEVVRYYAVTTATVDSVLVQAGDMVQSGDVLITYDAADLELAIAETNLSLQSSNSEYLATMEENYENQTTYNQAVADVANFELLIEEQEAYIEALEDGIASEREARQEEILREIEQINIENISYQREIDDIADPVEGESEISYYRNLIVSNNMRLQQLSTEQSLLQNFEASENKDELLELANEILADLQADLRIAEADRDAAEAAIMNGNTVSSINASNDLTALQAQAKLDDLLAAQTGVIAEFDGIVTAVSAMEGAPAAEGTLLIEVSSAEDISVVYGATRYDLEDLAVGQSAEINITGNIYNGEVSRIDHMATAGSSGSTMVNVEISVDNPDENIFLGIDGKVTITTAVAEDVLVVPVEAVNTSREGDFCYVVEDGVVHVRYVTTGISSSTEIEILDGLEEGDEVVTTISAGLADGVAVIVMNDLLPAEDAEDSEDAASDDAE